MKEVKCNKKQCILSIILSIVMIITIFPIMPDNEVTAAEYFEVKNVRYTPLADIGDGIKRVEVSGLELAISMAPNLKLDIPSTVTNKGTEYTVTSIGNGAFSMYGKQIIELTIPATVTSIGDEAFKDCSKLANINISDSVTSIGTSAFNGCKALTSITIPEGVTTMGQQAFYKCEKLATVEFKGNDKLTKIAEAAFMGCVVLNKINIPDSVTVIAPNAFKGCTKLSEISIPDNVKILNLCAFGDCTALTTVNFSGNSQLTSIGDEAFKDCSKLANINIPDSVETIGSTAFDGCPDSVSNPFSGREILIKTPEQQPNGVGSIGVYSAETCTDENKVQRLNGNGSTKGYIKVEPKDGYKIEEISLTGKGNEKSQFTLSNKDFVEVEDNIYSFIVPQPARGYMADTYELSVNTQELETLTRITNPTIQPFENGASIEKIKEGVDAIKTVDITTDGTTVNKASVAWKGVETAFNDYKSNSTSEQEITIKGKVTLPETVCNPNNVELEVTLTVTVKGKAGDISDIKFNGGKITNTTLWTNKTDNTLKITPSDGMKIYYTDDGNDPTTDGTDYDTEQSISIALDDNTSTKTIKVIQASEEMSPSGVVTITIKYDATAPSGSIEIGDKTYNAWELTINEDGVLTFSQYLNTIGTVTITANDKVSGIKSIEYYDLDDATANNAYTEETIKTFNSWISATMANSENGVIATFDINQPGKGTNYIVYAKLTDNAGNVKYLSTNGIVMDISGPEIKAKTLGTDEDGKQVTGSVVYTTKQEITVTDKNLSSVTVTKGDSEFISTKDGDIKDENNTKQYTFDLVENGEYTITATDKAENGTKATVTLELKKPTKIINPTLIFDNGLSEKEIQEELKERGKVTIQLEGSGPIEADVEWENIDNEKFKNESEYDQPVEIKGTIILPSNVEKSKDTNLEITVTITVKGKVKQPIFNPQGGTYDSEQTVTITSETEGATIYYTTDKSDPTTESKKYSKPILIEETTTLKAIAVKKDKTNSEITTAEYTIEIVPVKILSIKGLRDYLEGEKIDLSGLELEVKMSNGTTKTVGFADFVKYAIKVSIENGTILNKGHRDITISLGDKKLTQSIQVKAPSEAETVSTPTFSKEAGQYKEKQMVEIRSATEGAMIYYTTDGSTPTESSTVYKGAIEIEKYTELKAIAVKGGMNPSKVASGIYIINTTSYKILNTNGSLSENEGSDTIEWSKAQEGDLIIRLDGDINKFKSIMINGEIVDRVYYTLESGSTIIKLKRSYIDTLESGIYSLMVNYEDGSIEMKLAVSEKPNEISEDTYTFSETNAKQQNESLGEKLKTGDSRNSLVWLSIIILASEAMIILIYKNKKSSKYNV